MSDISFVIGANDAQFQRAIKGAQEQTRSLGRAVEQAGKGGARSFDQMLAGVGKFRGQLALVAGAALAVARAIDSARENSERIGVFTSEQNANYRNIDDAANRGDGAALSRRLAQVRLELKQLDGVVERVTNVPRLLGLLDGPTTGVRLAALQGEEREIKAALRRIGGVQRQLDAEADQRRIDAIQRRIDDEQRVFEEGQRVLEAVDRERFDADEAIQRSRADELRLRGTEQEARAIERVLDAERERRRIEGLTRITDEQRASLLAANA